MIDEECTRRGFLKSLARLSVLAGMGVAGAAFLRGRLRPIGETCVNEGVCRGCAVLGGCGLPQALSVRERAEWARVQP